MIQCFWKEEVEEKEKDKEEEEEDDEGREEEKERILKRGRGTERGEARGMWGGDAVSVVVNCHY